MGTTVDNCEAQLQQPATIIPKSFAFGQTDISIADALGKIKQSEDKKYKMEITTARIEGKFANHIELTMREYNECKMPLDVNIVILDSYDGVEHKNTQRKNLDWYPPPPTPFTPSTGGPRKPMV